MKKLIKYVSILLVCQLCISITGCKKNNKAKTDAGIGAGKQTTFTYARLSSPLWSDRYASFTDLPIGKQLEKNTGTTLVMHHVKDATAMNLLITSGDLSDIIEFSWKLSYAGGEQKAIQDGVVYGMTEGFVQKYAPDYWNVISSDPDILKQVKTPEGQIIGFSFILADETLRTGRGLIIRDDWCKEVGISIPETPGEYYTMLELFKNKKNASVPLSVTLTQLEEMLDNGYITSPFGLPTTDAYINGGKVILGYVQPEYKTVLVWLHKLYNAGLLDPNFSTLDSKTCTANILTGKSGASAGAAGSSLGTWLSLGGANYSLAGIKGLVAKKGTVPMYTHYNNPVVGTVSSISTFCKDKAAAAKFLNYGYTPAGHMLYCFGIEGESYTMKDDVPAFTSLITNNTHGLTPQQAIAEYTRSYENGPFVQDTRARFLTFAQQKEALEKAFTSWAQSDVKKYKLPAVTIAAENAALYSSISSDINSYRSEMLVKFVRGTETLDHFDQYITALKQMGCDKVQQLQQTAYEEYLKR
jgi:putative aldouronate transport system substrate-binding protein